VMVDVRSLATRTAEIKKPAIAYTAGNGDTGWPVERGGGGYHLHNSFDKIPASTVAGIHEVFSMHRSPAAVKPGPEFPPINIWLGKRRNSIRIYKRRSDSLASISVIRQR